MASFRDQVESLRPKLETEADKFEEEVRRAEDFIRKAVLDEASRAVKERRFKVSKFLFSELFFEVPDPSAGYQKYSSDYYSHKRHNQTNKSIFVNVDGIYHPPGVFRSEIITHHFNLTTKAEKLRSRLKAQMQMDGFTFDEWGLLPCASYSDKITTTRKYWIDGVCGGNIEDVFPFPLTVIRNRETGMLKMHCISKFKGIDKCVSGVGLQMVLPFTFM